MSLPSWNDSPSKQAILDFIASAGDTEGSDYIAPAERIATFDNDGTLWVEQPAPAQTGLLIGKLVEEVKTEPQLATEDPYKSIINRDEAFMTALAQQIPTAVEAFLKGVGKAWEGTTPDAFDAEVKQYLAHNQHPRYERPWTDLVYRPMLELFDLLRENEWRIFICSGGGRDFMRVFCEEAWGVPRENVIGSSPEFAYEEGQLVRRNELHGNIALGPGKPESIYARTGRLPRFAAGNGDVDLEMLEVADFALVIVHDDGQREYAYDTAAGKLQDAAAKLSWTIVSMKDDWNSVFEKGIEG